MERFPRSGEFAAALAVEAVLRMLARAWEWLKRRPETLRVKVGRTSPMEIRIRYRLHSRSDSGAELERSCVIEASFASPTKADRAWLGRAIDDGLNGDNERLKSEANPN
jgi:hypothetical protein